MWQGACPFFGNKILVEALDKSDQCAIMVEVRKKGIHFFFGENRLEEG